MDISREQGWHLAGLQRASSTQSADVVNALLAVAARAIAWKGSAADLYLMASSESDRLPSGRTLDRAQFLNDICAPSIAINRLANRGVALRLGATDGLHRLVSLAKPRWEEADLAARIASLSPPPGLRCRYCGLDEWADPSQLELGRDGLLHPQCLSASRAWSAKALQHREGGSHV